MISFIGRVGLGGWASLVRAILADTRAHPEDLRSQRQEEHCPDPAGHHVPVAGTGERYHRDRQCHEGYGQPPDHRARDANSAHGQHGGQDPRPGCRPPQEHLARERPLWRFAGLNPIPTVPEAAWTRVSIDLVGRDRRPQCMRTERQCATVASQPKNAKVRTFDANQRRILAATPLGRGAASVVTRMLR